MSTDRRTFLRLSALAGGALASGAAVPAGMGRSGEAEVAVGPGLPGWPGRRPVEPAARSMRLLILGGTGFIGPHTVNYAVARGHQVTVFNRGRTQTDLPDGVEQLTGDRNLGEVEALRGREWDAVLDNPTHLPFWVRDVGEVLQGRVGRYLFISTLSAYDTSGQTRLHEGTPLLSYPAGDPLEVTPEFYAREGGGMYGPMKAASEAESRKWFGEDAVIVRPGLIVGPLDGTDRFTYWPVRMARGGDVLAPGTGLDPVQVIDVRDLAEWTVRLVEDGTRGTFNGVGPRSTLTMAEQLHAIRGALSGDLDIRIHWAPVDLLQRENVRAWSEMPTWFGPDALLSRAENHRSVEAGLTFRPLAETVRDTLDWWETLPADRRVLRAGIDPEKEARVLALLR